MFHRKINIYIFQTSTLLHLINLYYYLYISVYAFNKYYNYINMSYKILQISALYCLIFFIHEAIAVDEVVRIRN